jgi:hypothetical protein
MGKKYNKFVLILLITSSATLIAVTLSNFVTLIRYSDKVDKANSYYLFNLTYLFLGVVLIFCNRSRVAKKKRRS